MHWRQPNPAPLRQTPQRLTAPSSSLAVLWSSHSQLSVRAARQRGLRLLGYVLVLWIILAGCSASSLHLYSFWINWVDDTCSSVEFTHCFVPFMIICLRFHLSFCLGCYSGARYRKLWSNLCSVSLLCLSRYKHPSETTWCSVCLCGYVPLPNNFPTEVCICVLVIYLALDKICFLQVPPTPFLSLLYF